MLLGESEPAQAENLSHQLRVISTLFDVLSGQSEVDHPLCEVSIYTISHLSYQIVCASHKIEGMVYIQQSW